jgi:type II secretory pathway pseudopilin PulG
MRNKLKNKKGLAHRSTTEGFTMVETLFGIAIFIVILMAITIFSKNIWVYNSFVSTGLSNVDTIRQTMETMTAEIRTASAANTGAYAVNQATATSFIFYSDIYDNGLKERVRYFLNGSLLQKGVIVPTGSPLSYNTANEKITTLLPNVTNSTIFSYYDENYNGLTAALSFPVDVSVVRLIKITAVVNTDPFKTLAPITFSTQVSIRNLKDNL